MLPSWVVQRCPSLALAKAHTNIPIVVNVMCGTYNEPLQKLFRLADISFSTSMWEVKDHSVEDSWAKFSSHIRCVHLMQDLDILKSR